MSLCNEELVRTRERAMDAGDWMVIVGVLLLVIVTAIIFQGRGEQIAAAKCVKIIEGQPYAPGPV